MVRARVDAHAVAHPDFPRLADLRVWVGGEERHLCRQLVRQPQIIRVEKCDEPAGGRCDSTVPRCGDAVVGRAQHADPRAELALQHCRATV
jgi:hypothetical protein